MSKSRRTIHPKRDMDRTRKDEDLSKLLSGLLARYPSLMQFVTGVSDEDFTLLSSSAQYNLTHGIPINPPTKFVRRARQLIPRGEWRKLQDFLRDWSSLYMAPDNRPLESPALVYMALGLLWQTLLLNEWQSRMEGQPS